MTFRERFHDVFPKSLPHYGPQEVEGGVTDIVPGDHIERLLCALVGLVLNRKKDVEYASPSATRPCAPRDNEQSHKELETLRMNMY